MNFVKRCLIPRKCISCMFMSYIFDFFFFLSLFIVFVFVSLIFVLFWHAMMAINSNYCLLMVNVYHLS